MPSIDISRFSVRLFVATSLLGGILLDVAGNDVEAAAGNDVEIEPEEDPEAEELSAESAAALRQLMCSGLSVPPLESRRYGFFLGISLVRAAEGGRTECALDLLSDPASDANVTDSSGKTALAQLVGREIPEAGESTDDVFSSLGPTLIQRTELGCSEWRCNAPMVLASSTGRSIAVRALLAAGASPDAKDKEGEASLQHAAAHGHLSVVKALLVAGANLEGKGGEEKRTALHRAASHGQLSVVNELLGAGADTGVVDAWGRSPKDLAEKQGHDAVLTALIFPRPSAPVPASKALRGTAKKNKVSPNFLESRERPNAPPEVERPLMSPIPPRGSAREAVFGAVFTISLVYALIRVIPLTLLRRLPGGSTLETLSGRGKVLEEDE